MITKNTKVALSLRENGSTLVRKGNYESAEIEVKNAFLTDGNGNSLEKVKELTPMKTKQSPKYEFSTKNIILGYDFILGALERPAKPHKKASQKEWDIFVKWNKMSNENKIAISCEKLAQAYNAELISFELME